jgi:hypothetical protein
MPTFDRWSVSRQSKEHLPNLLKLIVIVAYYSSSGGAQRIKETARKETLGTAQMDADSSLIRLLQSSTDKSREGESNAQLYKPPTTTTKEMSRPFSFFVGNPTPTKKKYKIDEESQVE